MKELLKNQNISVVLVDHNKPKNEWITKDNVIEIVDHHKDENFFGLLSSKSIKTVGSCCTLISEKIFEKNKKILEDEILAELLMGTILLNCVNFDKKIKKGTELDRKNVERLSKILKFNKKKQDDLFIKLQLERFNISSLTEKEILRADYKHFDTFGIASCRKVINDEVILEEFSKTKNIEFLFVMIELTENDQFRRELVIFSKNLKFPEIEKVLNNSKLKLTPKNMNKKSKFVRHYEQKNLDFSRKKVSPILEKLF